MTKTLSSGGTSKVRPLSIEDLELGLRLLGRGDTDHSTFWDENIAAFRQTVLFAIRETSDGLLSTGITPHWRTLLETQLEALVDYLELTDRYAAGRAVNCEPVAPRRPSGGQRIH